MQCGSFGKATAQLGYTQSAMTHLVNKLEAELGCTLLSRSSHGVRLSEEGEHLLPYIQDYLRASDALRQEAALQGESHNHVLRIGCFASIARARLPALLAKFRKLHPEIKIDVLVGGYELATALEEERVQLALVEGILWQGLLLDAADGRAAGGGGAAGLPLAGGYHPAGAAAAGDVPLLPGAVCGAAAAAGIAPAGGHRLGRCRHTVHGGCGAGRVRAVVLLAGGL